METTPASLLDQVRRPDDRAAWERFVRLYAPLLLAWARRLGVQDADAADLVQDVFVTLVRALPTFHYQPGGSFRRWLGKILVSRLRDRQRKARPVPLSDDAPPLADAATDDPVAAFDQAEYNAVLTGRALALVEPEFSATTWAAFRATVIDELPVADAAEFLRVTPNVVYLARSRVLRRLREVLAGLLEESA